MYTYLAVNELDVMGTLCITVSGSVSSTSLVIGVLGLSTIGIHGGEVNCTVQTARKVGDVDVEGELPVLELGNFVVFIVGQEVNA